MDVVHITKGSKTQDFTELKPTRRMSKSFEASKAEKLMFNIHDSISVFFYETELTYIYYFFDNVKNEYAAVAMLYKKLNSISFNDPILANYPQVCWIYIRTSNKDKNLSKNIYKHLAFKHEGIWSDTKQTKGATNIWLNLCYDSLCKVDILNYENLQLKSNAIDYYDSWYQDKNDILLLRMKK